MIRNTFLFDMDGTLVDSVYQHVLSWHEALLSERIDLSVWKIHRKIGMSGGLFINQLLRELDRPLDDGAAERLRIKHRETYTRLIATVKPLPGAQELLATLTEIGIPWAVATSGRIETAALNLQTLGVDPNDAVMVTRDQVRYAKPDPDLFLTAAERLGCPIEHAIVVGDSIWDMLAAVRCKALGVGLLAGGYGQDELERSGALRVYEDPADLLYHLDEVCSRGYAQND